MAAENYIYRFQEISYDDISRVGGKAASLGEMYQALNSQGIEVPDGFAISADAYRALLERAGIERPLRDLLRNARPDMDVGLLRGIARQARELIYHAGLPDELSAAISAAYAHLCAHYGQDLRLAVRSSATAEDLPNASFAGQHDSFLNVEGEQALLDACRRCFASLFNERAISYRLEQGFDHFKVALAIAVMKMVRADLAASGVMFTLDTDSGFRDVVFITGAYGLGENIVQGAVDPDEFYVHKPTFINGSRCVLRRQLGVKQLTMVCDENGGLQNSQTPPRQRQRFCLSDQEILTLADYGIKTEAYYSRLKGAPCPMDIEWAKDGIDGKLYLVQARPETVVSQQSPDQLVRYRLTGSGPVLARGRAIGAAIAGGVLRKIDNPAQLAELQSGEVLLAESTSPDWGPVLRRAAALITVRGGRTCHAAIVAREFGIPAVVGIGADTERLQTGQWVTVSCAEGDTGKVYEGAIPFETVTTDLSDLAKPRTRMMINLGNPDQAFRLSALPCDGVGLARMEFIINTAIKAHPMALLHPERISDAGARQQLEQLLVNYPDGAAFFIEKLSEGIGTLAAAFYPRPVIVRTSDFKSNEYADLLGGADFEPREENPMLGLRGAARYTHPSYAEAFALECAALRRARAEMGLVNIKLMIPFCRRVAEAQQVLAAMAREGLRRGDNGLEIYMMCEIPNNVVQIDAFSALFDGISIGSNDLTQLTLGVDRDSELMAFDFDERDPGVMLLLRQAIEGAHRNHIPAGICGQAPSDYPEVAEYLVSLGIDSMSLNPDALLSVMARVAALEQSEAVS